MTDLETRNLVREWEHRRDVAPEPVGTGSVAAKRAGGVGQGAETLTEAQERALRWFPADGVCNSFLVPDSPKLVDLTALLNLNLVADISPRRWRLTKRGIARRAAL